MAWYDDIWDFASDVGGAAWDFAKENPALAGAGAGLVAHHLTGGKGEDNLAAAGLGAALGSGASMAYETYNAPTAATEGTYNPATAPTPSSGIAPSAAVGSSAASVGTGVAANTTDARGGYGAYSPEVSGNTGITGDTGGDMMGPPVSAAGTPTLANRLSMGMNTAKSGLQTVRKFGADNEDVLRLGGKALSAYMGSQAKTASTAPVQAYNEKYAAAKDAVTATNTGLVDKQNAIADQQAADYTAINPQRSGQQAYASTLSRIAGQAQNNATAETNKGYSAATVAANKRRGLVGASTGATTAAGAATAAAEGTRRAGLNSVKYTPQSTSGYDSAYAGSLQDVGGSNATQGAYGLVDDVFGLSKKKADEQVGN